MQNAWNVFLRIDRSIWDFFCFGKLSPNSNYQVKICRIIFDLIFFSVYFCHLHSFEQTWDFLLLEIGLRKRRDGEGGVFNRRKGNARFPILERLSFWVSPRTFSIVKKAYFFITYRERKFGTNKIFANLLRQGNFEFAKKQLRLKILEGNRQIIETHRPS